MPSQSVGGRTGWPPDPEFTDIGMRGPVGYASSADRSRDRRGPAWLPLAAAAVVVPTVLAGLSLLWPGPQIRTDLGRAATESLAAAGLSGAGVSFDGRDATISGIDGPDAERAVGIVEGVTGVRVAQLAPGAATGGGTAPGVGPAAPAPATPGATVGVTRRGEDIVLSGEVASEEERAALVEAATAQAGGRAVVDELTASADVAAGVDVEIVATTAAVVGATGDGVGATVDGDALLLTGAAPDQTSAMAVEQALATALPALTIDNQLTVAPAPDGSAGAGTPGGDLDDAGRQELQSAINALVAGAPITFEPDSGVLTPQGSATVSGVLELVTLVPAARLQVDGFVATGPGNGQLSAQALSEQRAATVRDALVAGGVPTDNVTAQGRGEGDTPATQAAGRRVDVTVI